MLVDNYSEFMHRLDAAAASLQKRQDRLGAVRSVLIKALGQNQYGLKEWTKRLAEVESLLRNREASDRASLQDLHSVATKMESLFRERTERIGGRFTAIQRRFEEVSKPLHALRVSREKLIISRRIAEERENFSSTVQDFAGTAAGVSTATPDLGLHDDLMAAREAVVLAEALLELKDY